MKKLLSTSLLVACIATTIFAHPGSGIVVDRKGVVYFLDTGGGVWKIDPRGKLTHHANPRFHWMAIDERSPDFARLPSPRGGELTGIGMNPRLLVSSDVPVAVGSDGAIYYPELGGDGRLRILRFTRAGEQSVRATLPGNLRWINGLASAPGGSLYYTEDKAVRKIDARGAVTPLAENVSVPNCSAIPGTEPGTPYLRGLAVRGDGAVFVAASGCGAVLKITRRGEITTILRTTSPWSPTAVAVSARTLYVLEYVHTEAEDRQAWIPRVRKVLPNGQILTIAAVERAKTR